MKYRLFLFLLALLVNPFHGCGNPNPNLQKIYSWQDRELVSCVKDSKTIESETEPEMADIDYALSWISSNIKNLPDDVEYWQTSCETIQRKAGDCEDHAILLWKLLRDKGFSDSVNRIGWFANKENSKSGHMAVILHFANQTLIIDPPNHYQIELTSYLQDHLFYSLIFEFNLHSIWEY